MFQRQQKKEEKVSVAPVFFQGILVCVVRKIRAGVCSDFTLRKQLTEVKPATLGLLRAAGTVPVFLELLQDKGEKEKLGRGTKERLVEVGEGSTLFPMACPLKPVLHNLIALFR